MAEIAYTPPLKNGHSVCTAGLKVANGPALAKTDTPGGDPSMNQKDQAPIGTVPSTRASTLILDGQVVTTIHDSITGVKLVQDPSYVATTYGDSNEQIQSHTLQETV